MQVVLGCHIMLTVNNEAPEDLNHHQYCHENITSCSAVDNWDWTHHNFPSVNDIVIVITTANHRVSCPKAHTVFFHNPDPGNLGPWIVWTILG